MKKVKIDKYNLPGGSLVEVHKVFGNKYYIAIADLKQLRLVKLNWKLYHSH